MSPTMKSLFFFSTFALSALARPAPQSSKSFLKQNGIDAINLNKQFQTLSADSSCDSGDNACVNQQFAQCVDGKFVLTECSGGLICAALPLVNSAGTSITCTTQSDVDTRIAATGATDGDASDSSSTAASATSTTKSSTSTKTASSTKSSSTSSSGDDDNNDGDLQTSLCLDNSLIQTGFEKDGQQTPAAGQVASLTSGNNYINFCATSSLPLTNGQQVKGGSCNAAPMGIIASVNNMPSSKFVFPANTDTIKANTAFTVKMAVRKLTTGNFVNAAANYFSAPQQIDDDGNIVGHSHIVIEKVNGMKDTTPTDPSSFAFFKGLNDKAEDGILSADVTDGLPEGTYRIASINSAANHQPVLVAIAQHGSLDDMVYFTVTANGRQTNNSGDDGDDSDADTTSTSVAAASTTTSSKAKGSTKTSSAVEEATATVTASADDNDNDNGDDSNTDSDSATTSSAKKSSSTKTSSADDEQATETATASSGSKNADSGSGSKNHTMSDVVEATTTMAHNAVKATSTASSDNSDSGCDN